MCENFLNKFISFNLVMAKRQNWSGKITHEITLLQFTNVTSL